MYVYDPVTKKTTKLLNGLDWLHLSTFPDGFKEMVRSLDSSLREGSEAGCKQNLVLSRQAM